MHTFYQPQTAHGKHQKNIMHTLHLFFIFYLTCLMPSTALYSASLLPQERRHSTAENSARINQYLIAAIRRNDLNKIDRFLQLSVNLNVEDKDGATPLKAAIEAKSLQIVELLLRSGARANPAALKFARRLRDAANPDGFEQVSLERIVNKLHDARFGQTTSVPLRQIPQPRQTQQPHVDTRAQGFNTEVRGWIRNPQYSLPNAELLSIEQQGYVRAIKKLAKTGFSQISPFLLSGPPGTGKTYFAEGIAAEIKSMQTSEGDIFTFFHIKASALNAGYAGDGVLRIEALIRYCKAHPNVVIFIDELDTLFNRDSAKDGSSTAKNMSQTTAEIWQLLDTLEKYPSILVMGATNHEDDIDAALLDRFSETLSFERISDPAVIRSLVEQHVKQADCLDEANVPSLLPFGWLLWKPFLYVYPLSHREIKRFARNAMLELLKSDNEGENTIQSQHWSTARGRLMHRKMLPGLTKYCTRENFSLLMSAISVGSALYQCYRSHQQSLAGEKALRLQEEALTIQRLTAQMQHKGLQVQKDGLATQQLTANMQGQGLDLQQDALDKQNEALNLQTLSTDLQKKSVDLQEKTAIAQFGQQLLGTVFAKMLK